MAFPPNFQFASEADFTDRLLVPLLTRLGFSMVVHYHGSREFGRDLIVGEFDRFGHVKYHGVQAKYLPSIGRQEAHGLIEDCREAFTAPFRHPSTGAEARISMFYAINGGSISTDATELFARSICPQYGDNGRLLDGKAISRLDQFAYVVGTAPIRSLLMGVRVELDVNARAIALIERILKAGQSVPAQRLRIEAVSEVLRRPEPGLVEALMSFESYWQDVRMFNGTLDSLPNLGPCEALDKRIAGLLQVTARLLVTGATLQTFVKERLAQIGPLLPV